MDSFDHPKHKGDFPEKERIQDTMLQAFHQEEGESIGTLLQRVVNFTLTTRARIMRITDLMYQNPNHEFNQLRYLDTQMLAKGIGTQYRELTPDAVRVYFLVSVLPILIRGAARPFGRPDMDAERHAIAPLLTGLLEGAMDATKGIDDSTLQSFAVGYLERLRTGMAQHIQTKHTTRH